MLRYVSIQCMQQIIVVLGMFNNSFCRLILVYYVVFKLVFMIFLVTLHIQYSIVSFYHACTFAHQQKNITYQMTMTMTMKWFY